MRSSMVAVCFLCVMASLPTGAMATKYAGEFMAVGGGARALGMGGAFTAVAADASTVYWNPAGVSGLQGRQALAMHSERFGDLVNYNFASYMQPTGLLSKEREAGFGFALQHLGIDDIVISNHLGFFDQNQNGIFEPDLGEYLTIDGREIEEGDLRNLPKESDNSFAFLSTFAFNTGYGRLGGTLKLIYTNSIAGNTSTGIGIDIGYLYQNLLVNNLNFGLKLQDATGTYLSWSSGTNEYILPAVKVGAAYKIVSKSLNGALLLALDSDFYFDNRRTASQLWVGRTSADIHGGAELSFQEKVMVRGGVDSGNWTAGAGFLVSVLGFDYAYLNHDDFDATHRVSVLVNF
ncbi:MAG: UPF0164 family protein [Candidatus Krumholzibacteria bacterium]|nr:UPF0164 family protein [Candidatus Krumholzibacteria bacterium]